MAESVKPRQLFSFRHHSKSWTARWYNFKVAAETLLSLKYEACVEEGTAAKRARARLSSDAVPRSAGEPTKFSLPERFLEGAVSSAALVRLLPTPATT